MSPRPSARSRILEAAFAVVRQQGGLHMTLDAVAAAAGVSKGGLLYHFPSQRALLSAMMQLHISRVESRIAGALATIPAGPAQQVLALVEAMFDLESDLWAEAHALLAAVAHDPDALAEARARHRAVEQSVLERQAHPERVRVLLLALDGIWMSELIGVEAHNRAERESARATLRELAEAWCEDAPGATASPEGSSAAAEDEPPGRPSRPRTRRRVS